MVVISNFTTIALSLAAWGKDCHAVIMQSYHKLIPFWVLMAVLGSSARAKEDEPPMFYPFTVKIGEQEAAMKDRNDLFAVIEKPVKADATLKIAKKSDLLIINAFPCKEDGTVVKGDQAVVIFGQNTDAVKMDATMTKKPLKPGTYLMNIVAHGKTSRVVFTIADPKGDMKLPKLGDIIKFLKGDS